MSRLLSRFVRLSFLTIVAAAFIGNAATLPAFAQAKKMSKAEEVALKQAIASCKAEAKGKKVKWLSRRKYVNNCVQEALKDHPNINVQQELKDHPDLKGLPTQQADAF